MSVINNKGFVDSGVTDLQIVEKFPVNVARIGFTSLVNVELSSIERVGTSDVFDLNYTLVHTMTYRPVSECASKTTIKSYNISFPLKLTTPPAVGTLPDITTTTTLGDQVFINTCGGCPDGAFNKYVRYVTLEFEVEPAPAPAN